MGTQLKRYTDKHLYIILALLFMGMSVVNIIWLWHFHLVYYSSDTAFHLARMTEAQASLIHGHFAEFSQYTTLPYGQAVMTYYPWLTLIPFEFLTSWLRPVNQYYTLFTLIYFTGYLISFFSYKTYSKKASHCFTFAVLYMNSSIFFNWETDFGTSISYIFLPLVAFGFIALIHKRHWMMLTIGASLVIYTHVLDSAILAVILVLLVILNIPQLKLKGVISAMLAGITTIILTSPFWYPALVLSLSNKIQTPSIPLALTKGLWPEIGATVNYCYGFVDIIGLLTIFCCRRRGFKWTDFSFWLIGSLCLIINVKWVCHIAVILMPQIKILQFVYRTGVEGNILFLVLAMNWLFGKYRPSGTRARPANHNAIILALVACYLVNPLWNTIDHRFLLQSRPTMTSRTVKALYYAPNEFDQQANATSSGLYTEEHIFYNLDYAPNSRIKADRYDLQQNILPIVKPDGRFIKTAGFKNENGTIIFHNDSSKNGAQLPFMRYNGVDYQYRVNGRVIPAQDINKKLSHRTDELVVRHLPRGTDKVRMTKSKIRIMSPEAVCRKLVHKEVGK